MKNKKVLIAVITVALVVVLAIVFCAVNGIFNGENAKAKSTYQAEATRIASEQKELDAAINKYQTMLDAKEKVLEKETQTAMETAITDARAKIIEVPKCPLMTSKIKEITKSTLAPLSYTEDTKDLEKVGKAYADSIKQYKQVDNPSEAFVIERTKDIEGVLGYAAVTEDNDPNGNLNKAGGYTATIYYRYDKVPEEELFLFGNETIVDIGTDGGAAIEVYANEKDAKNRNDYLAQFDGGILSSGAHTVVGTVVVRTSTLLTASQQNELSKAIINNLIEIR